MALRAALFLTATLANATPLTKRSVDPTEPFYLNATSLIPPYPLQAVTLCPISNTEGYIIGVYSFPHREHFPWTLANGALVGTYDDVTYTSDYIDPENQPGNGTYAFLAANAVGATANFAIDEIEEDHLVLVDEDGHDAAGWWICPPLGGAEYGRVLTYGFVPGDGTSLQNSDCTIYNVTVVQL